MNRTWNDDHVDRILREAMHARPDPLPLQNLALRAVQRAGSSTAPRRWSEKIGRCLTWQGAISVATIAVMGLFIWLAAACVVTRDGDDLSTSAATTTDQVSLLQEMASDEAVLNSAGILLFVTATIAIHRALAQEGPAFGASGLGDWA